MLHRTISGNYTDYIAKVVNRPISTGFQWYTYNNIGITFLEF
jgi:hypothetical protein